MRKERITYKRRADKAKLFLKVIAVILKEIYSACCAGSLLDIPFVTILPIQLILS